MDSGVRVEGFRMDGHACPAQWLGCADVDLRAALGFVAPPERRLSQLPRSRACAGGLSARNWLHARGADADHRASLLRIMGLSNDGLFRAHLPVRDPAGSDVLRRSHAREGYRGDSRLGAVALS